jgi:Tfp pilus assembly protein FimV
MRRDLLLVLLLATGLATGVAQTDKKPGTEHAAGAAKNQQKEAVTKQKEDAQAKTKVAQEATAEAQTKKASEQTEAAQATTETEQKDAQSQTNKDPKLTSVPGGQALGMSILGNQEAPTSLVIVPWKSSEVGRATGISPMLDDSRQPVDKEVFMRELQYYEIRSEKKP